MAPTCRRGPDVGGANYAHVVRVRYAETDQAGMAHHAAYLTWFEEGRVGLLRALGKPYQELEALGTHFPVREVGCRYKAVARFDDLLTITTSVGQVGGASVRFEYVITRGDDKTVIAEGYTRHACVGDDGRVRRLSGELRDLLFHA